jgi:hypothetical protein
MFEEPDLMMADNSSLENVESDVLRLALSVTPRLMIAYYMSDSGKTSER